MVDDRPEENWKARSPSPDSGRARRAPPTIDLEAPKCPSETARGGLAERRRRNSQRQSRAGSMPRRKRRRRPSRPRARPASFIRRFRPWVIAPVSGAVAAALVIGVGWMLGWPAVAAAAAAPQVNAAAIDELTARVAGVEAKAGKSAAARPIPRRPRASRRWRNRWPRCATKSPAARAQSEKLAADVNDVKSAPREAAPRAGSVRASTSASPRSSARAAPRAPRSPQAEDRRQQAGRRRAAAPGGGGVAARIVGAAGRSVCRGAGGGEIARAESGCAEAARGVCRHRRAERRRAQPRTADAGAETVAAGAGECRPPAPASSIACRPARRSWSASSAPTPSATIAARWSRGSPRRRCATISPRRGAN